MGMQEKGGEEFVELILLLFGELQGVEPSLFQRIQLTFPFFAHSGKQFFHVGVVRAKLVLPLVYGGHVVEDLAGEQAVLCRGYERLHLRRSTGNEDGKIGLLDFAVFLVRTSVVREEVMVESPAQRVAPMAVVGADGGGYGVRFRFKDDSRSVGIHDILQDACTCVVARYDEHPVGRHLRFFHLAALLAHGIVAAFRFFVGAHLLFHLPAYLVVYGLYQQTHKAQYALAGCGRGHDECLETGRLHLSAVKAAGIALHAGS